MSRYDLSLLECWTCVYIGLAYVDQNTNKVGGTGFLFVCNSPYLLQKKLLYFCIYEVF
jgi:hypothetical protein